ncbi:hypothetical protein ACSAZK_01395 [Methanosarcina sp. Mfa9]|uniref:hypothetical protein n=1 Tax=Methanosarcina sp. Mfa9 TaxID=3439063 RepID=UPI003F83C29D
MKKAKRKESIIGQQNIESRQRYSFSDVKQTKVSIRKWKERTGWNLPEKPKHKR